MIYNANQELKQAKNRRKCGKQQKKWFHCEPVRLSGVAIPPSFRVLIGTFPL